MILGEAYLDRMLQAAGIAATVDGEATYLLFDAGFEQLLASGGTAITSTKLEFSGKTSLAGMKPEKLIVVDSYTFRITDVKRVGDGGLSTATVERA